MAPLSSYVATAQRALRQHGAVLAVGFVAVIGALAATWYGITYYRSDRTPADQKPPAAEVGPVLRRAIDGVRVSVAETPVAYLAVAIDNQVAARPASGIGQAPLVFEVPVEGGITRLLAVFPYDAAVSKIGPVRSARPYFIDWATEFDATFVHVGGSPEAMERLAKTSSRNMDEIGWGKYFWRDTGRKAPHNVYTSSVLLGNAEQLVRGKAEPKELAAWQYKEEAAADARPTEKAEPIRVPYADSAYAVSWAYDRDANAYVRTRGTAPEKDADGRAIAAKNVVIMEAQTVTLDSVGRKRITTVGEGAATVYRDGAVISATWKKPSLSERLRFFAVDGTEVAFNPGITWIQVVEKK